MAKAREDDSFKNRLLTEPKVVLREHGVDIPESIEIQAVEGTDKEIRLTRVDGELSDSELSSVNGGSLGTMLKALAAKLGVGRLQHYAETHNIKPPTLTPKK